MADNYIILSDLQIPFEAKRALEFCLYVQKFFKIPKENVLCVGDEVDLFHASSHKKGADFLHTPNSEIEELRIKLKDWYKAFPRMRIATSNHGLRYVRKAFDAEIPSVVLKTYQEILQSPKGWQWADKWIIDAKKKPFVLIHGMGYSGHDAQRKMAIDLGINVAHGHLHSTAGVSYIRTETQNLWGMNTGCLIDTKAYAFSYGKWSRFKPCLGVGVVINGGTTPIWIPYET